MAASQPHNLQWTRGVFQHPADLWPRPRADSYFKCWSAAGEDLLQMPARCFQDCTVVMDGSCSREYLPELSRAAWALAVIDDNGLPVITVTGAVDGTLPQTPQAAEHVPMAVLAQLATGTVKVWSDCLGVVRDTHLSRRDQLRPNKVYAGVRRFGLRQDGAAFVQPAQHTKAHRSLEAIQELEGEERAVALGNRHVDSMAKQALELQPAPTDLQQRELAAAVRDTKLALKTLAATLRCFPLDGDRKERLPLRHRVPRVKKVGWHTWCKDAHGLRCATCHRTPLADQPLSVTGCTGWPLVLKPLASNTFGHHLRCTSIEERGIPLFYCVVCGRWAIKVCKRLLDPCTGPAAQGTRGRRNLELIAQGKRPDERGGLQQWWGGRVVPLPPAAPSREQILVPLVRPPVASRWEALVGRIKEKERRALEATSQRHNETNNVDFANATERDKSTQP
jgi:hypothetical protein